MYNVDFFVCLVLELFFYHIICTTPPRWVLGSYRDGRGGSDARENPPTIFRDTVIVVYTECVDPYNLNGTSNFQNPAVITLTQRSRDAGCQLGV